MNVKITAKKILSPMSSFKSLDSKQLPDNLTRIALGPNEECLGIYQNADDNDILVTDIGLYIISPTTHQKARFADIKEACLPPKEKTTVDRIELRMSDHELIVVPIKHGKGRFKDVFEFTRFMDRVLKMVRNNN